MARIKFGAVVVDGSGKLGGHVFSKNRGGNYLRTKTTPVNPQTAAQTLVRATFANISSQWSALTNTQRQSWEDRKAEYARTNIFGDLKNPNGKSLFQRLNQALLNNGKSLLQVCPPAAEVPIALGVTISATISPQEINFAYTNDLTNQTVIVYATPPVSAGTSFVKNKLRKIASDDGGDGLTTNLQSDYTAKFGAPVEGEKIVFGIQTMNANGQLSAVQNYNVVVTAS